MKRVSRLLINSEGSIICCIGVLQIDCTLIMQISLFLPRLLPAQMTGMIVMTSLKSFWSGLTREFCITLLAEVIRTKQIVQLVTSGTSCWSDFVVFLK